MPIRTRTHDPSPYLQTDEALQNSSGGNIQPVSIGSATKPVDWRRTNRTERTPLARPKSSSNVGDPSRRKPPAPVIDASDSFLGVFLPRPSVNLTRSSYSDIRPSDVKATQNFQRPTSSRSQASDKQPRSKAASDIYKDGLAPDFKPIELVSVELLFNPPPVEAESEPAANSKPTLGPPLQLQSTVDSGSVAPSSDIGLTEDRPGTPSTPKKRKSFNLSRLSAWSSPQQPTSPSVTDSPSRRSLFGGKSKSNNLAVAPPLPRSPSPVPSSRLDKDTSLGAGDESLRPPQPAFLRESASRRSFSASSRQGSEFGASTVGLDADTSLQKPRSTASLQSQQTASPQTKKAKQPTSTSVPPSSTFKPKMTTILSRFSSRQMGDHKCRRGYPIAVFAGAQSMDVGSITNTQVEGSYSLFFGPGHPQNLQELMSESEQKPSHLQNPKPATTAATARRAELIATTRALQAIHDLYQGKACAHVCMDSAYVAKAWGSWIPKWEEEGWPGDEHVKRRKDSGYRGSGSASEIDEPVKRSSKRLADEDLLRQMAAIRRLYARAERKGTGAAHLYLIDKNVNPAHKSARQILDNTKVMAASSPPHSPRSGSRRDSMTASRASMSVEEAALAVPRHRRQRSMLSSTGSQRNSRRGSVDIGSDDLREAPRDRERGTRASRHRSGSVLKAAPALQEETPSEVAAPSAVEEGTVLLERRPSVKSAASAVTALDEDEANAATNSVAVPAAAGASAVEAPKTTAATSQDAEDEKPDGMLAAAAASAGAFLAGVAGYGGSRKASPSPPNEKVEPDAAVPEEPDAVVPEESDMAPAVPKESVAVEPKATARAAPAPALKLAEATPTDVEEGELTAVERTAESPKMPIVAPLKTTKSAKPVRAATTKELPVRMKAVPEVAAVERSKSVDKPAAPASAHKRTPSGGRLINYSKRESNKKNGALATAAAAPAVATTVTASSVPSDEDANAPLASVVEDEPLDTVPSRGAATTDVAVSTVASSAAAPAAAPSSRIKKRSSMPAVRQSVDGGAAPSVRSTSSKTRKFRTLSFLGGRKGDAAETTGLAPEEEDWALEAERKAANRKSSLFRKGNKKSGANAAPPLPEEFREKIALESSAASPIVEDVIVAPRKGSNRARDANVAAAAATAADEPVANKRKSTAPGENTTSAFDDDDDDAAGLPASNTRMSFLGRNKEKSPKPPKAPKAPKEPKPPKEPFSFKKKMSHLMTME